MSPKGDYHRLGHGTDDHVRRPRKVAAPLQGKKVVSVATGSLHCVACTDHGEYDCICDWEPLINDDVKVLTQKSRNLPYHICL